MLMSYSLNEIKQKFVQFLQPIRLLILIKENLQHLKASCWFTVFASILHILRMTKVDSCFIVPAFQRRVLAPDNRNIVQRSLPL
jgi:hypothetical protein